MFVGKLDIMEECNWYRSPLLSRLNHVLISKFLYNTNQAIKDNGDKYGMKLQKFKFNYTVENYLNCENELKVVAYVL